MTGCLFCLLLYWGGPLENWSILVITAKSTRIDSVTALQLRQIYQKKLDRIGSEKLTPIQPAREDPARHRFEKALFGKRFDLDNYWLEQKFRGGEKPPLAVANPAYMLVFVERNPGFIGYVGHEYLEDVKRLDLKILRIVR